LNVTTSTLKAAEESRVGQVVFIVRDPPTFLALQVEEEGQEPRKGVASRSWKWCLTDSHQENSVLDSIVLKI
jgi:hypothetical protein